MEEFRRGRFLVEIEEVEGLWFLVEIEEVEGLCGEDRGFEGVGGWVDWGVCYFLMLRCVIRRVIQILVVSSFPLFGVGDAYERVE